jgi:DNA repair protein RecN (Recombination protein N)
VLALKNVLSQTGSVATVVFDEVDSGIGGATAEIVGRKLKDISVHHQVICITHLPQIASYGTSHLKVSKKVAGGRTATMVESIDEHGRIEEIGRMLGGVDVSETAKDHARAMIARANTSDDTAGEGGGNAQKSTNR